MYMFARIRDTDVHLKGIIVEWLTANQSAARGVMSDASRGHSTRVVSLLFVMLIKTVGPI
jgi:hypothetical protein